MNNTLNDNKSYTNFSRQLENKLSSEINGELTHMFYRELYIELYHILNLNFSHKINELLIEINEQLTNNEKNIYRRIT